jgi:hypothetical protein
MVAVRVGERYCVDFADFVAQMLSGAVAGIDQQAPVGQPDPGRETRRRMQCQLDVHKMCCNLCKLAAYRLLMYHAVGTSKRAQDLINPAFKLTITARPVQTPTILNSGCYEE